MENRNLGNTPVIPLPNVGEGGPVYPGPDASNTPVVPLPNPGEGGPVYPGNGAWPNRPNNRPTPNRPSRPSCPYWPNPSQPSPSQPSYPGGGVQLLPGTTVPGLTSNAAAARFLNSTKGYPPFRIAVDGSVVVPQLSPGYATSALRVSSGTHTVSVLGQNGYVYLQQRVRFARGAVTLVSIVNRPGGLALRTTIDR